MTEKTTAQTNTSSPASPHTDMQALISRIEELEHQIHTNNTDHIATVTVADMNQMYSNHLVTIDLILGLVAFLIVAGGSFLGWLGYRNIQGIVDTKITELTKEATQNALNKTEEMIKPLRAEYEAVINRQNEQERQINFEHHLSKAYRSYEAEEYEQVIDATSQAINLNNSDEDSYLLRGAARFKLKENKKALADVNKALKLGLRSNGVYLVRGLINSELKHYEQSIADFDEALKLMPESAITHYNKACILSRKGEDISQILPILKRSIELDPEYKDKAIEDEDFNPINTHKEFKELVGLSS